MQPRLAAQRRKPLSAWDDTVKKMRNLGLDKIAEVYARDYTSNH